MLKQAIKEGIVVSIAQQSLSFYAEGKLLKSYPVSTSLKPPSCEQDSWGTPWGEHMIIKKIGAEVPLGMVFKGRKPTGKLYTEYSAEDQAGDLITSRILRLRGEEEGINSGGSCDTYKRMIYIHGTNHESKIGQAVSKGCIRMCNNAIAELFDLVEVGTRVWIS